MYMCRKMRKPDHEPGSSTGTKKRPSMSTKSQPQTQSRPLLEESEAIENPPPSKAPSKKISSISPNPVIDPPSLPVNPEPRLSFETVPAPPSRKPSQPQEIKSRPSSPPPLPYSQVQAYPPHPSS